ncbi:hypothetical protein SESBI_09468 [Sesbania bispinosa]|nr:hypothetical protein SESBI_09468 [Sesbania bispinosa]
MDFRHIPQERNVRADVLYRLASIKSLGNTRTIIQKCLAAPSINQSPIVMVGEDQPTGQPHKGIHVKRNTSLR